MQEEVKIFVPLQSLLASTISPAVPELQYPGDHLAADGVTVKVIKREKYLLSSEKYLFRLRTTTATTWTRRRTPRRRTRRRRRGSRRRARRRPANPPTATWP